MRERLHSCDIGSVALSSLTVSELYFGAYKSQHVEKNLLTLEYFLKPFSIVEYGIQAAKEYGELRAKLQKNGQVIGSLDMLIAAHARSLGMVLVTNNTKEFARVEELEIEDWI